VNVQFLKVDLNWFGLVVRYSIVRERKNFIASVARTIEEREGPLVRGIYVEVSDG